jgi:hypothetical protein
MTTLVIRCDRRGERIGRGRVMLEPIADGFPIDSGRVRRLCRVGPGGDGLDGLGFFRVLPINPTPHLDLRSC